MDTDINIQDIVQKLELAPHPEGGWFRETYRSPLEIVATSMVPEMEGPRNLLTSIYYLLAGSQVSKFHKLLADEIWYFHSGTGCVLHLINSYGTYDQIHLGLNLSEGQIPQVLVPAGTWFGAEVSDRKGHALVGCAMAPGFDFKDWQMGEREALIRAFPSHAGVISRLT